MISVIICSADPVRFTAVQAMYHRVLGSERHEVVGVHDARSLAEGYGRGVAASHGQTLIFSHDDVEILSDDLPGRLERHLERFDLIGVVGTSRLIGARWISAGPPHIFGQVCHLQARGELVVDLYGVVRKAVANIQALDGLFIAARRNVLDKIAFDAATFDGFHLYDLDFSFQAYRAGMALGVVSDINLLHHSGGAFDQVWKEYAQRFMQKWQGQLSAARPASFQSGGVLVASRAAAVDVMNPFYLHETP